MKKVLFLLMLFPLIACGQAKKKAEQILNNQTIDRPKLVVGIVVDQMRYDFLYRYYNKYGGNGFKRLMNEGFTCRNHHYPYALTVTAAGHASVYTGSVPAVHGIAGNEWFDQKTGKDMYCVEDNEVTTVGSATEAVGKMSPKNLLTSTLSDQLRIGTNFQSKVVGVAIKDRGAILPAGHTGQAYWFDGKTGNWVTSTFYRNALPEWLEKYNAQKRPAELMKQGWNTLLPIASYTESTPDDEPWETKIPGAATSTFPYELVGNQGNPFGLVALSPHGNTITKEIAIEAIKNEQLGKGTATDLLAVSFSTPDYVGHSFGPNSVETEDVYLRLDKDLAEMLSFLDGWVGKNNYTVFLTADHGVMDVVDFWKEHKLPTGKYDNTAFYNLVKKTLVDTYGEGDYLLSFQNNQLYLNYKTLESKKISVHTVTDIVQKLAKDFDEINAVFNMHELNSANLPSYFENLYKNTYHAKRSGDIQVQFNPGWIYGKITATHGSSYNYDTHIPLLLMGWGIKKGETFQRTYVSDTAPTISALLKILEPSGNIGNPIEAAIKGN